MLYEEFFLPNGRKLIIQEVENLNDFDRMEIEKQNAKKGFKTDSNDHVLSYAKENQEMIASYLIEFEGFVVGVCQAVKKKDESCLMGFEILGRCWGKGVVLRAMRTIINDIKKQGYTEAEFFVNSQNERLIGLLSAFGFEKDHEQEGDFLSLRKVFEKEETLQLMSE